MRIAIPFLALSLLLTVSGPARAQDNKDTFDKVISELLTVMDKFSGVLEGIQNEKDAKDAKDKMKAEIKKLEDLGKRSKTLGEPSEAQRDALKKKFGDKLKSTFERFGKAVFTVSKYPTAKEMIKEFGQSMQKIGNERPVSGPANPAGR